MERLEKIRSICEEKISRKESIELKLMESREILRQRTAERRKAILELCASDKSLAEVRASSGKTQCLVCFVDK